jgi:hypothetical protein
MGIYIVYIEKDDEIVKDRSYEKRIGELENEYE